MRHEDFMKKVNERARVAGKSAQYFPPGETWLPKMLDKSIRSKVSDISEILEWNPNAAMAFCGLTKEM